MQPGSYFIIYFIGRLFSLVPSSVADPGCLSRILIFTHYGSRIQKQQQKREVKKNLLSNLFCCYKFHKIVNNFIFEMLKKKIWAIFKEL
jgi:hypothetical protein